jgi:ABC-2 type transport system permease protein
MNSWRTIVGFTNGLLILGMATLLGAEILWGGFPEFLALLILGVGATTAIGVLAASLLIVAKRSEPILTLYGLMASLLGGALFSVDQLPPWLSALSFLIPHTYVINSARTVLMEDPGSFTIPFSTAALILLGFNLVVGTLGMWTFHHSLQFARREGILGGY